MLFITQPHPFPTIRCQTKTIKFLGIICCSETIATYAIITNLGFKVIFKARIIRYSETIVTDAIITNVGFKVIFKASLEDGLRF